jgi:hypothetical protein
MVDESVGPQLLAQLEEILPYVEGLAPHDVVDEPAWPISYLEWSNWACQRFDRTWPFCIEVYHRSWVARWPATSVGALASIHLEVRSHWQYIAPQSPYLWELASRAPPEGGPGSGRLRTAQRYTELFDLLRTMDWWLGRLRRQRRS